MSVDDCCGDCHNCPSNMQKPMGVRIVSNEEINRDLDNALKETSTLSERYFDNMRKLSERHPTIYRLMVYAGFPHPY